MVKGKKLIIVVLLLLVLNLTILITILITILTILHFFHLENKKSCGKKGCLLSNVHSLMYRQYIIYGIILLVVILFGILLGTVLKPERMWTLVSRGSNFY